MSFLLPKLTNKSEVDEAIKSTEDVVLVLRFGRDDDNVCMQLDHIVSMLFKCHWFSRHYFQFHFHFINFGLTRPRRQSSLHDLYVRFSTFLLLFLGLSGSRRHFYNL